MSTASSRPLWYATIAHPLFCETVSFFPESITARYGYIACSSSNSGAAAASVASAGCLVRSSPLAPHPLPPRRVPYATIRHAPTRLSVSRDLFFFFFQEMDVVFFLCYTIPTRFLRPLSQFPRCDATLWFFGLLAPISSLALVTTHCNFHFGIVVIIVELMRLRCPSRSTVG